MDLLPYDPPGLFGREPERNAFVELHNGVVAALDAPGDFGPADAERIGRGILTLPLYPSLRESDVERVCDGLARVCRSLLA